MTRADPRQLQILKQGPDAWNAWRVENPGIKPCVAGGDLQNIDLAGANLEGADLFGMNLLRVDLEGANLRGVDLRRANLREANLNDVDLRGAQLYRVNLNRAHISGADLRGSNLYRAYVSRATLRAANLQETDLGLSTFVSTDMEGVRLSRARVYGISVWDMKGEPADQEDLIITPEDQADITTDNLKMAQFVYLLLNNAEIRDVLDTVGQKGVLLLGRFSPERKQVLDALRTALRQLNFLPMMFDFEGATTRDFTETVKILAGMCRFVIVDITSPKSSPMELQATVPDYKIPFAPIIQENEAPFSMFVNLQDYPWMLDLLEYENAEQLVAVIDRAIIQPAQIKADEINLQKAGIIRKRHAKDYY
jgi:hypothetical protein